jgi:uncharacterized protein
LLPLSLLEVPTSCDGCGACCLTMTSPPGYAALFPPPGVAAYLADESDLARLQEMPEVVVAELRTYYEQRRAASDKSEGPCIWLDMETRRCKHYEHRPDVCREAVELGDGYCFEWRRRAHQ